MKNLRLTPEAVQVIMEHIKPKSELTMLVKHSDLEHIEPLKLTFYDEMDSGMFGSLKHPETSEYLGSIFLREGGFQILFSTPYSYMSAMVPVGKNDLIIVNS